MSTSGSRCHTYKSHLHFFPESSSYGSTGVLRVTCKSLPHRVGSHTIHMDRVGNPASLPGTISVGVSHRTDPSLGVHTTSLPFEIDISTRPDGSRSSTSEVIDPILIRHRGESKLEEFFSIGAGLIPEISQRTTISNNTSCIESSLQFCNSMGSNNISSPKCVGKDSIMSSSIQSVPVDGSTEHDRSSKSNSKAELTRVPIRDQLVVSLLDSRCNAIRRDRLAESFDITRGTTKTAQRTHRTTGIVPTCTMSIMTTSTKAATTKVTSSTKGWACVTSCTEIRFAFCHCFFLIGFPEKFLFFYF